RELDAERLPREPGLVEPAHPHGDLVEPDASAELVPSARLEPVMEAKRQQPAQVAPRDPRHVDARAMEREDLAHDGHVDRHALVPRPEARPPPPHPMSGP